MAGADIAEHVLQEVARTLVVPEVMVCIDNGQLRLEDFFLTHRQPLRPNQQMRSGGRLSGGVGQTDSSEVKVTIPARASRPT
jgi:hypothetical protein